MEEKKTRFRKYSWKTINRLNRCLITKCQKERRSTRAHACSLDRSMNRSFNLLSALFDVMLEIGWNLIENGFSQSQCCSFFSSLQILPHSCITSTTSIQAHTNTHTLRQMYTITTLQTFDLEKCGH